VTFEHIVQRVCQTQQRLSASESVGTKYRLVRYQRRWPVATDIAAQTNVSFLAKSGLFAAQAQ